MPCAPSGSYAVNAGRMICHGSSTACLPLPDPQRPSFNEKSSSREATHEPIWSSSRNTCVCQRIDFSEEDQIDGFKTIQCTRGPQCLWSVSFHSACRHRLVNSMSILPVTARQPMPSRSFDRATDLVLLPDGSMMVFGASERNGVANTRYATLTRFEADGTVIQSDMYDQPPAFGCTGDGFPPLAFNTGLGLVDGDYLGAGYAQVDGCQAGGLPRHFHVFCALIATAICWRPLNKLSSMTKPPSFTP